MGVFCNCNLEIDVNGDGIFWVDKAVVCSYSGRFRKLFGKSANTKESLKVVFNDFPGGIEIFELIARFCYNNGCIQISPSKLVPLHCAANYMEMNNSVLGNDNLMERTEKSIEDINYWTWSDLLMILKGNQNLHVDHSSSSIFQKCVDILVGKLTLAAETSPCPSTSSSDSNGFRISCDSRSTESFKTSCSRAPWWFEDLLGLNPNLVERVIKSMVSQKLDHGTISRFLFHYQKSKFIKAKSDERTKIMEMVINSLYSLDYWFIPYKSLLGILRISLNLNLSKFSRDILEGMVGSRMDESTLDNLLIPSPSPSRMKNLYDVNLVLRLLKSFLNQRHAKVPNDRIAKVASLMDMYLAEVAPDPCLKSSKFIALATILPDSSRDCYDEMYHAIDMYLQVHVDLSEEEIFKICSALNYEKLSSEACIHLAKNEKFPSRSTVQVLLSQQLKFKSLLNDANSPNSCCSSSSIQGEVGSRGWKDESGEQIVLYAGKADVITEHENLRTHLQGMQCRVTELEKVCQKMQTQMVKMIKTKTSSSNVNSRSLPKFCS